MSGAQEAFDAMAGLDEWRGFCDPWDKAEEPGSSEFADWIREEREPTCLDCLKCAQLPSDYDGPVRDALGFGVGFCRDTGEYVTDECTAEELGNLGDGGCFERRW